MKRRLFLAALCLSSVSVGLAAPTLIYNGDFELGDVNFYSAYISHTNDPSPTRLDGGERYMVRSTWQEGHPNWPTYGDHTSGSGLMFMANGATDQRVAWRSETIPVVPGRNYTFTYYLSSSSTTAAPRIQTTINGQDMGTATSPLIGPDPTVGTWIPVSYTWNSGTSTTATVQLRDLNSAFVGNDFALDDINLMFSPLKTQKVFLNFDEKEVPFAVEQAEIFGRRVPGRRVTRVGEGHTMEGWRDLTGLDSAREQIPRLVKDIFLKSGILSIELVDTPEDATVVYFAKTPDISLANLSGRALSGIDTFNRNNDTFLDNKYGTVVVFNQQLSLSHPSNQADFAETIAHELGHTFGLWHIHPALGAGEDIVMDYRDSDALAKFYNEPTPAVLYLRNVPLYVPTALHNPTYHLLRYVSALSEGDLSALGVEPGTYDLYGWPSFIVDLDLSPLAGPLYDVHVFGGPSAGMNDGEDTLLASFDEITVSQLNDYEFALPEGMALGLYGASHLGGDWDVALATGNPFELDATLITPIHGMQDVFLQMWSPESPLGYVTLAQGTLTGTSAVIPAPGAIVLGAIGAGLVGYLRRRRVL